MLSAGSPTNRTAGLSVIVRTRAGRRRHCLINSHSPRRDTLVTTADIIKKLAAILQLNILEMQKSGSKETAIAGAGLNFG